jgi:serine/threonine-protein kinase RsbW
MTTSAFEARVGNGDELAAAQSALERWVEAAALPPRAAQRVQVVFEELTTNALRYGWLESTGEPELRVSAIVAGDHVELEFRDRGAAFDPTAAPVPARPATLAAAKIGGLGLELVRKAARSLAHRRVGGENVTTVTIDVV